MNNFKSCIPCVCTSSGCKRVCERHDSINTSYNVYIVQVLWCQIPILESKCYFGKVTTSEQDFRDNQTSASTF